MNKLLPLLAFSILLLIPVGAQNAFANSLIDTISVGNRPLGLAVDQVHNKIYVSNENDHTVSVIDGSTNAVIQTINVGSFPRG